MIKCPSCSTSLLDGTKFCTNCGAALEPEQVQSAVEVTAYCSECQMPLLPGAVACAACGAPVVVVEEVASAVPAPPVINAAVDASQMVESGSVQPLFPIATSQGYRCPTCEAFLQPGSTFCANCATKFAEAVPYGARDSHRGVNPTLPLAAAGALLLAGGIFAGWLMWGQSDDADGMVTTRTPTTIQTRPSATVTTTDTMTVTPAPEEASQVAIRIFNAARAGDWVVIYDATDMGGTAKVTNAETFTSQIEAFLGPDREGIMRAASTIEDVRAGEATIDGDHATVPVNYTVVIEGKTVEATSSVKLIRRNGVWKLDMSGSPDTSMQTVRDVLVPSTLVKQAAPPSSPPMGTTGDFEPTTGTTGMGG